MENKSNRYDTIRIDGQRVLSLRKAAKLTQAHVASKAKISRGYISQIESTLEFVVSVSTARQLAAAFNVDESEMVANHEALEEKVPRHKVRAVPAETSTFGSPASVGVEAPNINLGAAIESMVAAAELPFVERQLATRLIKEHAMGVLRVIPESLERD